MTWAHYLLQVNIYLVIFYCFYKLFLDKETYFVLNRIYLVSSGVFSLTIPFLRFEWFSEKAAGNQLYQGVYELNNLVTNYAIVPQTQEQYDWGRLIVIIYLVGVMLFMARFVYQLFAISKLLNTITSNTAFSFFKRKAVSNDLPEPATINLHEDIHVKQLHTVDVLFFEIVGIITWFNPIIYIYKNSIKNIHEYLADEAAANFQGDKELYSILLLSQAFGVRPSQLTNGFFTKSMIKKRIFMLHKQRSKRVAILKYGLFFPLFALALILSSASIRKSDQLLAVTAQIPLNEMNSVVHHVMESPLSMISVEQPKKITTVNLKESQIKSVPETDDEVRSILDEVNKSAWERFYKYLGYHIKFPTEAAQAKLQGSSFVKFTIKNSIVSDLYIDTELGLGCDEEVVKNINKYNGVLPKDGDYTLKATFKLDGANTPLKNNDITSDLNTGEIVITAFAPKEEDRTIYNFVSMETPPTFPGGISKFYEYLGSSIKYPSSAVDNEIQGNVFVSFTVEKDGSLSDFKVERSLGYGTDEEALRVLKASRKWNPGLQNGKPVRVKYNIPIRFKMASKVDTENAANIKLRIDGTNNPKKEPLYVIDGKVQSTTTMNNLDPNRIESISVLKGDLAKNSYGTRGEGGVILIKTKMIQGDILKETL